MPRSTVARISGSVFALVILLTIPALAQNKSLKPDDLEVERLKALIDQAKKEEEQFSKSGGQASDVNHPNLRWSATLWQYRLKHPDTSATTLATTEALRLLVRADRITEMQEKVNTLKLTDAAWKQVIYVLLSAANKTKDFSYLISKAETLSRDAADPEIKMKGHFTLADAYWRSGDIDQARSTFQTVVTKYPNTSYAEEAEGNIREIEFLNVGQPAPLFERTTINGDPISLASFKGKIVVLKFWGTY
jgi:TolA-binding protein